MVWLSVLTFALAANIDNLAVGFSYGLKHVRIPAASSALIAALTGAGTFAAMAAGGWLFGLLPPALCQTLGGLLLIGLGAASIFKALRDNKKEEKSADMIHDPARVDRDRSGRVEPKEAFLLAWALSLNNMGLGAGAAALALPAAASSLVTAGVSFLFIAAGGFLGRRMPGRPRLAFALSGLCVIALGVAGIVRA
ncbi:MAG: manganese efflux pump [Oscillospiraceae bacterium]|jgi:putative sporulation protein YtaF|nr:manganese efflux pump [Oscillospiraceae bacterium]